LPDLIRETIAGFRLQASERNITLTTDVQMSAIEVFLDPRKLKQVLLNYVSNAIKFTPSGGRVTVHAHFEEGSTFRLEVEDTGTVLPIEDSPKFAQLVQHWPAHMPGGAGFVLNWTDSLADGMSRLDRGGVDVILLDLGLPDCSGMETFIQARDRAARTPIVIL